MEIIKQQEVLGHDFKVYGDFQNPLFLAKDVAEWIENKNVSQMLNVVDEEEKGLYNVYTLGGSQEMWFLTEDGFYEVLMQSRKPIAKEFKKQVKAILKEIRKTGSYVNPNLSPQLQYLITLEQEQQRQALALAETKQQIEAVDKRIDNIKEIISLDSTSWRNDTRKIISKIALTFGGFEYIRDVQTGAYQLLEEKARVKLKVRLDNKISRMTREGVCKSKCDKVTKIDVIADDKKLIEIYVGIIRDLAVRYNVDLSEI